ncbi:YeeE/YedE family protein [Silvimonas sp.]|uniref:YeeE/YedE family protein n=1 Tax=Silvimonas sp. TaxID=2650811 RepID=UPI002849CDE5|nr:YeeE/YedE family protein [Silvimonas sp.]MDR3428953.1 YeeE/YedE family protein [Silvimonas sp.]
MTLDWQHFTPWTSLAGGILIGLAAAGFALFNGRIAGISGIVGGLLRPVSGQTSWRVAFVAGLVIAPLLWRSLAALRPIEITASSWLIVLAGLLVGIGTRYGAGCTSGHGVCGLSRLSGRSLAATLIFMAFGFATVFILRHVLA